MSSMEMFKPYFVFVLKVSISIVTCAQGRCQASLFQLYLTIVFNLTCFSTLLQKLKQKESNLMKTQPALMKLIQFAEDC